MKRLALLAVVLVAAGCGGTKTFTETTTVATTPTTTQAGAVDCKGSELTASFDAIEGSAGAGSISYALKLTNNSASACELSVFNLQLLDAAGAQIITHAPAPTKKAHLAAGASTTYEGRFSPDVPGQGDQQGGACEPVAHTLEVTVGGETIDAPINPPTSVCEQGSITFRAG